MGEIPEDAAHVGAAVDHLRAQPAATLVERDPGAAGEPLVRDPDRAALQHLPARGLVAPEPRAVPARRPALHARPELLARGVVDDAVLAHAGSTLERSNRGVGEIAELIVEADAGRVGLRPQHPIERFDVVAAVAELEGSVA